MAVKPLTEIDKEKRSQEFIRQGGRVQEDLKWEIALKEQQERDRLKQEEKRKKEIKEVEEKLNKQKKMITLRIPIVLLEKLDRISKNKSTTKSALMMMGIQEIIEKLTMDKE